MGDDKNLNLIVIDEYGNKVSFGLDDLKSFAETFCDSVEHIKEAFNEVAKKISEFVLETNYEEILEENKDKTIDEFLGSNLGNPFLRFSVLNCAITYGYSVKIGYCLRSNNYRKMHGLHTRRKLK